MYYRCGRKVRCQVTLVQTTSSQTSRAGESAPTLPPNLSTRLERYVRLHIQAESEKYPPLRLLRYISACGHPPQTKSYPVVCHSYPHLFANFGPLISIFLRNATLFVTLTPEFYQFISVYCTIHKLFWITFSNGFLWQGSPALQLMLSFQRCPQTW